MTVPPEFKGNVMDAMKAGSINTIPSRYGSENLPGYFAETILGCIGKYDEREPLKSLSDAAKTLSIGNEVGEMVLDGYEGKNGLRRIGVIVSLMRMGYEGHDNPNTFFRDMELEIDGKCDKENNEYGSSVFRDNGIIKYRRDLPDVGNPDKWEVIGDTKSSKVKIHQIPEKTKIVVMEFIDTYDPMFFSGYRPDVLKIAEPFHEHYEVRDKLERSVVGILGYNATDISASVNRKTEGEHFRLIKSYADGIDICKDTVSSMSKEERFKIVAEALKVSREMIGYGIAPKDPHHGNIIYRPNSDPMVVLTDSDYKFGKEAIGQELDTIGYFLLFAMGNPISFDGHWANLGKNPLIKKEQLGDLLEIYFEPYSMGQLKDIIKRNANNSDIITSETKIRSRGEMISLTKDYIGEFKERFENAHEIEKEREEMLATSLST